MNARGSVTPEDIDGRFDELAPPEEPAVGEIEIGRSREDRPVLAHRIGTGPRRVSLIGGCHADEPVGPRLLRRLVASLRGLEPDDPLLRAFEWWIIPHVNPDGAERNARWQHPGAEAYGFGEYLEGRVREPPGDDIEFGFPRAPDDDEARPETAAAATWWSTAEGPFDLHATLHGMAVAAGPWFLIEPAWVVRSEGLRGYLAARTAELGYALHDVERRGDKGFNRIERGFATRPSSVAMREHFLALDDPETASRFRPSSMEHIRDLGGDPLTLVSEMPLFLLPGVGETLGPPDPALEAWRERIAAWSAALETCAESARGDARRAIDGEAGDLGLRAMPVEDQMRLQWAMLSVALAAVAEGAAS